MEKKTVKLFQRIAAKSLRPLPNLTVSDWADQYRMLSSESSAEPGRWRTDRAPYQRAIMDAFTDLDVRRVVVMSCSQIGKSDIMNNVIGRFAHLAPAPILMIQPTVDMAQDYSKSRIAPMIRDTKVLRDIFQDVKSRESGNTILSKLFPGGRLIMGEFAGRAGVASYQNPAGRRSGPLPGLGRHRRGPGRFSRKTYDDVLGPDYGAVFHADECRRIPH